MTHSDTPKPISREDIAKNAFKVKAGMDQSQVLELVGTPTRKGENEWIYPFYSSIPRPEAGQKIIIGMGVIFENGTVKDIKYATICSSAKK